VEKLGLQTDPSKLYVWVWTRYHLKPVLTESCELIQ
jgi:hypothetical protein